MQSYNTHVKRIILLLVVMAIVGYGAKRLLTPKTFGKYGHYRAAAIDAELNRPLKHMTNYSCKKCHAFEWEIHEYGKHKTISCEFCHGPYADHVKNGKYVAKLPVKKGLEIKTLCIRCHNKEVKARPKDVIKTIKMPDHLRKQHVREDHICNQCHHVHAPLRYINMAKEILGLAKNEEAGDERNQDCH